MNPTGTSEPPEPRRGILCPTCRVAVVLTATRKPAADVVVRYVRCPECGARGKTREKLVAVFSRPATGPER